MKKLYNKIKPVGKRVIILVNTEQKNSHRFTKDDGTTAELHLANEFSWDSRVTNFTQGILLTDYANLKAGDYVLVHHNSMDDECQLEHESIPRGHKIFAIYDHFLYFGLRDGEIVCVDGYMLASRMYEEEEVSKAGIIMTLEPKQIPNKLKILGKPDSITDYEVGDIAIVYKYSDYEMVHNVNGKVERIIRLKYADCLAKETI